MPTTHWRQATRSRIQQCTGDTEQRWTVEASGAIQLGSTHCLDASSSSPGTVSAVLNTCSGDPSQQWTLGADYELVNTGATSANGGTQYCLVDPSSNTAGGTLMVSACSTSKNYSNYQWRLPAV